MLLLHLLVVIQLDLLHDHEVMPIDFILGHLLVADVSTLGLVLLSNAFLLIIPNLPCLARLVHFFRVICKLFISLEQLCLGHKHT